tara:strand:- start:440 stop:844 length:405 start_codon:yes stop_codon:yes gene_type:complete
MINFKKIKKVLLLVFITPASLMLIIVFLNLAESPNVQSLNLKEIFDITAIQNFEDDLGSEAALENPSFDYELVGYRSGSRDASVILKKNNKQYVVALGENLEGIYKLIKIDQDEIIFRNGEKLYKIENLVGKEN